MTARLTDYTGAVGRVTLEVAQRALLLHPSRFAVQPKADGAYLRIRTGSEGQITDWRTRSGERPDQMKHLMGARIGAVNATVHGEADLCTDSALAAYRANGVRLVHLFDCTSIHHRSIAREPYSVRREYLMRSIVSAENDCYGDRTDPAATKGYAGRRNRIGQYARPAPMNHGLVRVVPQKHDADQAWVDWVVMPYGHAPDSGRVGEGLVLVDLHARVGGRAAKRKVKWHETLDATVTDVSERRVRAAYGGREFLCARSGRELVEGDIIEVKHDGWYPSGHPRFPRIVRRRDDLVAGRSMAMH